MDTDLSELILPHTDSAELERRIGSLYARVDAEIAANRPLCVNRGVCCKFDQFGHRLFVTPVEAAYFVGRQRSRGLKPVTSESCPYQVDGKCTARDHRPLGCRVFYCDPAAEHWQSAMYEKHLTGLKRIGADLGVEYRYVDWLAALRAVGTEPATGGV